jgi:NADP-dependent 3-hydroxy acid dehydrogenase YdfG
MQQMKSLTGKVAWITGAGTGIGAAAAKSLAVAGAHIVLSGRRKEPLYQVVETILSAGGTAEAAPLDVADALATQAIADDIAARLGGVAIYFANAGLNVPNRRSNELTPETFDTVINVNLNGVMYGILAVLPHMRPKGAGTIIINSSWAGRFPSGRSGTAYSAAKHALTALSHSINMENGMDGIRCCLLMPGGTNTPIHQARANPPSPDRLANLLQPADLGALVRYIAEAPPHMCFNEIVVSPTKNPTIAI